VFGMSKKRYLVLVIEHKEEFERNIEDLLRNLRDKVDSYYGKTRIVYQGSDEQIMTALERVLKLTE
jgi:hypothetical protein